ncbi:hypothetical protein [Scytonema sp. PCC 10023]|uniref:hypothetical protein n=1 Tax=Scytonema sp. PCC 10023 TaxID=1680591 RepID=UPI0039C73F9E
MTEKLSSQRSCLLTSFTVNQLFEAELTAAEWRLWAYLASLEPLSDLPDIAVIIKEARIKKSTFYTAIAKLHKYELVPKRLKIASYDKPESRIRETLRSQLEGLSEVITPTGRIDILTDTEIIEVKGVREWKSALGQILVYSALYPSHKKRIHLFGEAEELKKLPDIEAACLPFGVLVTGEEIE